MKIVGRSFEVNVAEQELNGAQIGIIARRGVGEEPEKKENLVFPSLRAATPAREVCSHQETAFAFAFTARSYTDFTIPAGERRLPVTFAACSIFPGFADLATEYRMWIERLARPGTLAEEVTIHTCAISIDTRSCTSEN
jgi:hypothetical protein